jgi:CsoR family transcriptional regulator, copper-sensing transcriptional repressor
VWAHDHWKGLVVITPATLQRLKSARGHLDAVIRMVEDGRYCVDVLHQVGAVQGALEHARVSILEDHLRSCVRDAYGQGRFDDIVDELIAVMSDDLRRTAACAHHHDAQEGALR